MRFNVKGFKPNELSVKVEGRTLRVTARHEEEGDLGEKASKNFDRKMDLPDNVDEDLLSSELSSNGILCIQAPVNETEEQVSYPEQNNFKNQRKNLRAYQQDVKDHRDEARMDQSDTGGSSFTIGEPFNAVSLKSEDRIMTPRVLVPYNESQARDEFEDEWDDIHHHQCEQQNKTPLQQHHRHRPLFPHQKIQHPTGYSYYRRTSPIKAYTPITSYVENRETFTPTTQDHDPVSLPSGFRPGTEETEAVYHSGGFITGPASAFANLAIDQGQQQQGSRQANNNNNNVFGGGNNPFNSLTASFSPMFPTSGKISKRGASHLEQINRTASKLKLKVDIGEEYLPEDIQVCSPGPWLNLFTWFSNFNKIEITLKL